ncbi:MAG: hypothetical protein Q8R07_03640, partial [Candidatus Uhrbacteria bacterium]|nr:hypothetical protein [Candidatus Uhrbacteria bacterium]
IARWIFQAELLPPWLAIVSGMSATITYIAIMSLGRYAAEHRANEALRTLTTARFHHMML